MKTAYYKEYSHNLGRDMEFKVYGHGGKPMLVFPCQDGRFFDLEDRGMVDVARPYIDEGRLQLFCCDSDDINSWSRVNDWDNRNRIEQAERFFHYICDELCPRIFDINAADNGGHYADGILTTGCSMGASHAVNFLLRRPDIFAGCIAMSGSYDAKLFFGDYKDDLVYANCFRLSEHGERLFERLRAVIYTRQYVAMHVSHLTYLYLKRMSRHLLASK